MKRQTLYAVVVAVVLGLAAVFLTNTFLDAKRGGIAPEGTTKVAVAAVPLDYGTELTPELFRFIDYPTDALPAGTFQNGADLVGPQNRRIVLAPIAANEPILAGKVTGSGEGASIAALLPDGKRAVSVRINDVSGVAGFIQPNDSVDVLITRQLTRGEKSEQVTDVVLQNTRIIAMGQRSRNEDGKPAIATTATLEVTPLDAQKLALGQQVGELSLVLRKPGEKDGQELVETVSLEDLRFGTSKGAYRTQLASAMTGAAQRVQVRRLAPARPAPVRQAQPRPAPAPATNNVGVVRGTTETNYDVGGFGG